MKKYFILLIIALGLLILWNWESVNQTVHQSTLIEINEKGEVLVTEPIAPPELNTSLKNPAETAVNSYNKKSEQSLKEVENILKDSEKDFEHK